ncbi:aspartate carbamoyltransferase catalytic subunit [Celeribacter sp.]|uniref:aspartate carbamoyltransferase catalytic subunit n=1 Tax=Celeribacter sp. TaxID=1890673 RepID=UPI003A90E972
MSSGWDDLLANDEQVLWQGQPDDTIHLSGRQVALMTFGALFAGFAYLYMRTAAQNAGPFWMFGLIHFAIGMYIALAPIVVRPYLRKRTWYSLTNRRAFIARDFPFIGRTLNALRITPNTVIEVNDANFGTIRFRAAARSLNGGRPIATPSFDYIQNAHAVFQQIRDIQKGIA